EQAGQQQDFQPAGLKTVSCPVSSALSMIWPWRRKAIRRPSGNQSPWSPSPILFCSSPRRKKKVHTFCNKGEATSVPFCPDRAEAAVRSSPVRRFPDPLDVTIDEHLSIVLKNDQ
ncbi:MAG: hypothetical protein ABSH25_02070, partial [Syntrophorhabdales bacterium]